MSAVDWHNEANCRGHAAEFWPESEERMNVKLLKAICAHCPVRAACLDEAMRNEAGLDHKFRGSVYGGLTPTERDRLAKSGRYRRRTKAGAR